MPHPRKLLVTYAPDGRSHWRILRHYHGSYESEFELRPLDGPEPTVRNALDSVRKSMVGSSLLLLILSPGIASLDRVDLEIQAAIRPDRGCSRIGLLGLRLSSAFEGDTTGYPPRFSDNLRTGYAAVRPWPASEADFQKYISDADERRRYSTPDYSRPLRGHP
mgnify:CR=1 FL=1